MMNESAVALGYNPSSDTAPRVIAKGKGYVALKILELAKQNDVPVSVNPLLTKLLYEISPGNVVPEELYSLVADVLAWVYSLDAQRHKSISGQIQ